MRVLLADDDKTMARLASLALSKKGGHTVVVAGDGAEALRLAQAEPFDLILLDGMMPVMDGLEAFRRLREDEKTKAVPVIFLSAMTDPAELAKLQALGPAGIIGKPFDALGLSDRVAEILGGRA